MRVVGNLPGGDAGVVQSHENPGWVECVVSIG